MTKFLLNDARFKIAGAVLAFAILAMTASANTMTFTTAAGATESGGNPVDASATFTTGTNTVTITLTDLLANPKTVAQLISDISFSLSGGQTSATIGSSSGTQRTVNSNGTWSAGSTTSTGWGIDTAFVGGIHLTALGFVGPAGLIIGAPGAGNLYSNANASIAGNGPHNPFIGLSATFTLDITGVNVDSTIKNVVFSFGTTAGDDVPGKPPSVPDGGATVALLGFGLLGIVGLRRRFARC